MPSKLLTLFLETTEPKELKRVDTPLTETLWLLLICPDSSILIKFNLKLEPSDLPPSSTILKRETLLKTDPSWRDLTLMMLAEEKLRKNYK